jgi:hypothetical protein
VTSKCPVFRFVKRKSGQRCNNSHSKADKRLHASIFAERLLRSFARTFPPLSVLSNSSIPARAVVSAFSLLKAERVAGSATRNI